MSTLLSLVALRQLLLRVSSSSQLTLRSMRNVHLNYNLISAKRFSTAISLNGTSNNRTHSPGNSQSGKKGKTKSSLNSAEERTSSRSLKNSDSSTSTENNFVSSSSSSQQDDGSRTLQEILNFLSTLNKNSFQSKIMVNLLTSTIANFKMVLKRETPSNTQKILNSVGMKNLSSCLEQLDYIQTQLKIFGILVLLNAPGDYPAFPKICNYLAKNIDRIPSDDKQFLRKQLKVINEGNLWESFNHLQSLLSNYSHFHHRSPSRSSHPGLSAYIKTSLDHEELDSVALDDLLQNLRQRFVEDAERVIEKREVILGSLGMQKLCEVIEGKEENELTNNSLLNYFEIFLLFKSPQHLQFPLRLIRERLEGKEFSAQEMKILQLIMSKLTPELESQDSEIIQNILMGDDTPMSIMKSLIQLKSQDNFDSQRLHQFIGRLRQVLINERNLPKHSKIAAVACMEILCGSINQEVNTKNLSQDLLENSLQIFKLLSFPQSHPTFRIVATHLGQDLSSNSPSRVQPRVKNVAKIPAKVHESRSERSESLTEGLIEDEVENQEDEELPIGLQELIQELKSADNSNQFQKCLVAILSEEDQLKNLEMSGANSLLFSVTDFYRYCSIAESNKLKEKVTLLLNSLFEFLTQNMAQMKIIEIHMALSKCAKNVRRQHFQFYNEDFVEAAINKALDIGDETKLKTLIPNVCLLGHFHPRFIEVVSDSFIKRFSHDQDMARHLHELVARFDYLPRQWDTLKEILFEHPGIINNLSLLPHHVVHFLSLNLLPEKLLSFIFDSNNVQQWEEWLNLNILGTNSGQEWLLLIYYHLKEFYPEYKGRFPPRKSVDEWETFMRKTKRENGYLFKDKDLLERAFGGPEFVLTGIYHNGVVIDYCVALSPNGSPIRIKGIENIEDIDVKGGSLILIKNILPHLYSNNGVLVPSHRAMTRLLESFEYPFIELNGQELNDLFRNERGSWLKKQILQEHKNNMKKQGKL